MTDVHCPKCGECRQLEHHKTYSFCAVCAYRWDPRSYDEHQADAQPTLCPCCGKVWISTSPRIPCVECSPPTYAA